jgi:hypothetical protein
MLEYWVLNASIHHSILPLFHSLLRWSEAIEQRNEAYESFSAPASVNSDRHLQSVIGVF